MDKKIIYIVIIVAVVFFMSKQDFGGFIGGIVGIDCPEWRSGGGGCYDSDTCWIATDCDGDGNYEAYGLTNPSGLINRAFGTTGQTPEGNDYYCRTDMTYLTIYLWKYDTGNEAWVYTKDFGASPNADTSCIGGNGENCDTLKINALDAIVDWAVCES